ncbi:hypothetical protein IE81DRAFT_329395 [Ceraceosorus guamensis]|uniref:Uncharacterized protein n=1 Tax=Ceraceosorus guamensis TaxID=1522189 RepID=A0A316W1L7_9BASI|nr:hypothetical protein IE81DRAFT_329395 [Ceraceosorus guamensis]PWN43622.1 hypothetical protein IE81DRAFT_329395 [Ceraceosorus guamensis]
MPRRAQTLLTAGCVSYASLVKTAPYAPAIKRESNETFQLLLELSCADAGVRVIASRMNEPIKQRFRRAGDRMRGPSSSEARSVPKQVTDRNTRSAPPASNRSMQPLHMGRVFGRKTAACQSCDDDKRFAYSFCSACVVVEPAAAIMQKYIDNELCAATSANRTGNFELTLGVEQPGMREWNFELTASK